MPRLPAYRRRIERGKSIAIVTISDCITKERRDYRLGEWNSPQSKQRYNAATAHWIAAGRRLDIVAPGDAGLTIVELLAQFKVWAKQNHGTSEYAAYVSASVVLDELYGNEPVTSFSVSRLRTVQSAMVARGWNRKSINKQIVRLRSIFRWGSGRELVAWELAERLRALEPLREGKTTAPEPTPVKPVADAVVEATLLWLTKPLQAVVKLQRITGARGKELLRLKRGDIDVSRELWVTHLKNHKTAHKRKQRMLVFGERCQEILRPFMLRPDGEYLFSPSDGERDGRSHRERKKTPPGIGNEPGSNRKEDPHRRPGKYYTKDSYLSAITRACDQAFPLPDDLKRGRVQTGPKRSRMETREEWRKRLEKRWEDVESWRRVHRWHPHQLRHTAATEIERQFGLVASSMVLGHSSAAITAAVYVEENQEKVEKIMGQIG